MFKLFVTAITGSSCRTTCLDALYRSPLRNFSASSLSNGPYETLNVPRNASKAAIKASFYKLSKKYHPDVNKDQDAKSKFQAVSEAWSILGDDRKRREYDSRMQQSSSSSSSSPYNKAPYSQPGYHFNDEDYSGRRRGATYAWEYRYTRRTSRTRPPPPGQSRTRPNADNPFGGTFRSGTVGDDDMWWPFSSSSSTTGRASRTTHWRDPFSSVHVRRATGHGGPNVDEASDASKFKDQRQRQQQWTTAKDPWTREDRLKKESVVVRIAQVIGLLFFIILLGGGFR